MTTNDMKKILTATLVFLLSASFSGAEVYLTTDKSCYVAGDDVWCSAFSTSEDAVAYVELRSSDALLQCAKIHLSSGRGAGNVHIPLSASTGNYRLIAYTASDKADESFDYYRHSSILSIFNTFSNERVRNGVEIVERYKMSEGFIPVREGLSLVTSGSVELRNDSAETVSVSLSVYLDDGIAAAEDRLIASWNPVKSSGPAIEYDGEIVHGRIFGRDAAKVAGDGFISGMISFPGLKTDIYTSFISPDGTMSFNTGNVFGDRDVVCMLVGMGEGMECHFETVSPFAYPAVPATPALRLSRTLEDALESRSAALVDYGRAVRDTLFETLPFRKDHFFLDRECRSYILDDYNRFPTMEEEFVEIFKSVRFHRTRKNGTSISVLLEDYVKMPSPVWGRSLMMIDGVPVLDQNKITEYDPAIIKRVDIYPYTYSLGDLSYGGVVNFVTFKGNMPMVSFDDNVRIYDFTGTSYPMEYSGTGTVVWKPLVKLAPGESIVVDCPGLKSGALYNVVAEGLSCSFHPVYVRKSFRP